MEKQFKVTPQLAQQIVELTGLAHYFASVVPMEHQSETGADIIFMEDEMHLSYKPVTECQMAAVTSIIFQCYYLDSVSSGTIIIGEDHSMTFDGVTYHRKDYTEEEYMGVPPVTYILNRMETYIRQNHGEAGLEYFYSKTKRK